METRQPVWGKLIRHLRAKIKRGAARLRGARSVGRGGGAPPATRGSEPARSEQPAGGHEWHARVHAPQRSVAWRAPRAFERARRVPGARLRSRRSHSRTLGVLLEQPRVSSARTCLAQVHVGVGIQVTSAMGGEAARRVREPHQALLRPPARWQHRPSPLRSVRARAGARDAARSARKALWTDPATTLGGYTRKS